MTNDLELTSVSPVVETGGAYSSAWNRQPTYQQVNLYQPIFRVAPKIFSTVTLLQILAAVTLLLLGIYVHAQIKLAGLQRTASALGQQYQQLETQLAALEAVGQSATDGTLETGIGALQATAREHRELLAKIEQLAIKPNPGFGAFLEVLARHTLPGLWLTGIELREGGDVELRGTARDPQLVPRYLQQLPDEPRFKALRLGSVNIVRRESGKPDIDFVLDSSESGWGRQ
jgi:Tfp pilus assembly protein PilN